MDIDEWKLAASQHNGKLVVWVDQEESLKVKKSNLEGVCFVMTLDFVLKFQAGGTSPFYFVNGIRAATTASKGTNNVPDLYVIKQNLYQAEVDASKKQVSLLTKQINAAGAAQKSALKKQLSDLLQVVTSNRYGGDKMKQRETFSADFIVDFCQLLFQKINANVTANGPSYFLTGMTNPGKGGHAIAFSHRPDLDCTGFPGIYEYFDPNLGLFVFPSKQDMMSFFEDEVLVYYMPKNYSNFSMASYIASGDKRHTP